MSFSLFNGVDGRTACKYAPAFACIHNTFMHGRIKDNFLQPQFPLWHPGKALYGHAQVAHTMKAGAVRGQGPGVYTVHFHHVHTMGNSDQRRISVANQNVCIFLTFFSWGPADPDCLNRRSGRS